MFNPIQLTNIPEDYPHDEVCMHRPRCNHDRRRGGSCSCRWPRRSRWPRRPSINLGAITNAGVKVNVLNLVKVKVGLGLGLGIGGR